MDRRIVYLPRSQPAINKAGISAMANSAQAHAATSAHAGGAADALIH
jgi:hypothetical protein